MSGYDVEAALPDAIHAVDESWCPILSLAVRLHGLSGWRYSADADITQNLSIEAGWTNDNVDSNSAYAKFVFRLARTDRPVMLSDRAISKDVFDKRDMRTYTLDKVRRENKILVERSGGGIVVARGN